MGILKFILLWANCHNFAQKLEFGHLGPPEKKFFFAKKFTISQIITQAPARPPQGPTTESALVTSLFHPTPTRFPPPPSMVTLICAAPLRRPLPFQLKGSQPTHRRLPRSRPPTCKRNSSPPCPLHPTHPGRQTQPRHPGLREPLAEGSSAPLCRRPGLRRLERAAPRFNSLAALTVLGSVARRPPANCRCAPYAPQHPRPRTPRHQLASLRRCRHNGHSWGRYRL
jgi:hypothetical protein